MNKKIKVNKSLNTFISAKVLKLFLLITLAVLLLMPLAVVVGQVYYDYLRSNKNTTSNRFFPPGEVAAGCKVVNNSGVDYFVPFKTAFEWSAFKGNRPENFSVDCSVTIDPPPPCTFTTCAYKLGHPTPCLDNFICSEYMPGYNSKNCTFSLVNQNFFDEEGVVCCQSMDFSGCSQAHCTNNGSTCVVNTSYCSSAVNINQCNARSACSYYCADTLCSNDLGNAWYDPEFEYCCNPPYINYPLVCQDQLKCNTFKPPIQAGCRYIP